jgi:hypothetical protein
MRQRLNVVLAVGLLGLSAAASAQKGSATVNLSATVTGNQEQPKVLYIVPWKAPEVAAATRQNLHSQLVSVFAHVDRQALQRELKQVSLKVEDEAADEKM